MFPPVIERDEKAGMDFIFHRVRLVMDVEKKVITH